MWGWNHGLSQLDETLPVPTSIPGLAADAQARIAAGRVHSLVALRGNEHGIGVPDTIYAFGNGQNGRLGFGSSESAPQPEPVLGFEDGELKCLDVACGHDHSLVLACEP